MAEEELVKLATDTTQAIGKVVEGTLKEVWSLLDAAAKKDKPSDYLTPQAISAVQGK
jgi:hypothetical protein